MCRSDLEWLPDLGALLTGNPAASHWQTHNIGVISAEDVKGSVQPNVSSNQPATRWASLSPHFCPFLSCPGSFPPLIGVWVLCDGWLTWHPQTSARNTYCTDPDKTALCLRGFQTREAAGGIADPARVALQCLLQCSPTDVNPWIGSVHVRSTQTRSYIFDLNHHQKKTQNISVDSVTLFLRP